MRKKTPRLPREVPSYTVSLSDLTPIARARLCTAIQNSREKLVLDTSEIHAFEHAVAPILRAAVAVRVPFPAHSSVPRPTRRRRNATKL